MLQPWALQKQTYFLSMLIYDKCFSVFLALIKSFCLPIWMLGYGRIIRLGSHGIGNANSNGFQFRNEHELVIGNTWFRQKDKYKDTWQHTCSKHWHMIDYSIVHPSWSLQCPNHERYRLLDWSLSCKSQIDTQNSSKSQVYHCITPKTSKCIKITFFWNKIFVNAINSIELEANTWEDFKLKVLSAACDTFGIHKRKCQDWFTDNCEKIEAHLFQNPLSSNLSRHANEGAIKAYKEFQSVAQERMHEIENICWLRKAEEAQLPADMKNSKLFY